MVTIAFSARLYSRGNGPHDCAAVFVVLVMVSGPFIYFLLNRNSFLPEADTIPR